VNAIDDGNTVKPLISCQCLLLFIVRSHRLIDVFFDHAELPQTQFGGDRADLLYRIDMIADGDDRAPGTKGPLPAPGQCRGMIVRNDHFPARLEYPVPLFQRGHDIGNMRDRQGGEHNVDAARRRVSELEDRLRERDTADAEADLAGVKESLLKAQARINLAG